MKNKLPLLFILGCLLFSIAFCQAKNKKTLPETLFSGNPLLPGDYADPCILQYRDTFYLYATAWDSKDAIVWYSANFLDWKMRKLNWPTTRLGEVIWAPCVVKGKDGRFYLYSSTGHQIYVGASNHPMGPFKNLLPNEQPLVKNRQYWDAMHSIDADCFIDEDGQAYLYYGSGFEWKNGICAVGRLNEDMCTFQEQPRLITPPNYFEAPHMMKRNGIYYLMYSDGICIEDSYKVRYSTSKSPLGPFVEGVNSPILSNTPDSLAWSAGHHYTIHLNSKDYIAYHKQAIPIYSPFWGPIRQVSFDELVVGKDGVIQKVIPTRKGVNPVFAKNRTYRKTCSISKVTASDRISYSYRAELAFDTNNGTLWAAPLGKPAWIKADLGTIQTVKTVIPVFDIVDGDYTYTIEYSTDNSRWKLYDHFINSNATEWPHASEKLVKARFIRLTILKQTKEPKRLGLWELRIFNQ